MEAEEGEWVLTQRRLMRLQWIGEQLILLRALRVVLMAQMMMAQMMMLL